MNTEVGNPASRVFQACLSWWLHPILRKKDSLLFTESIRFRFNWFFAKHGLQIIDNDFRYAILQRLFNGYVFTARSSDLDLMFTRLGDDFNIQIRSPRSRGGWKKLPLGPIDRDKPSSTWDSDDDWNTLVRYIDEHWEQAVETAVDTGSTEANP